MRVKKARESAQTFLVLVRHTQDYLFGGFFWSFLFFFACCVCPSLLYHVWGRQFRGQVVHGGRGAC